jgi:hypothetical protein
MTVYSPLTIRARLLSYLTGQRPDGTKIEIPDPETMAKVRKSVQIHLRENLNLVHFEETEDSPDGEPSKNDLTDVRRRLVYGFIFGNVAMPLHELHTNELDPLAILALYSWIGSTKSTDPDGKNHWTPRDGFTVEANEIANLAWGWVNSPEKDRPLSILLAKCQAGHPEASRNQTDADLTSGAVLMGGVVHSANVPPDPGAKGIRIPQSEKAGEGMHWCDWCGQVLSSPGVPCKSCEDLGAKVGDGFQYEPRYTDVDTGKTVTPAPPLYHGEKPDTRPAWMKLVKGV